MVPDMATKALAPAGIEAEADPVDKVNVHKVYVNLKDIDKEEEEEVEVEVMEEEEEVEKAEVEEMEAETKETPMTTMNSPIPMKNSTNAYPIKKCSQSRLILSPDTLKMLNASSINAASIFNSTSTSMTPTTNALDSFLPNAAVVPLNSLPPSISMTDIGTWIPSRNSLSALNRHSSLKTNQLKLLSS